MTKNFRFIFIGIFLLSIGGLIYLIDRPPDQTYFIFALPFQLSFYDVTPSLFGPIGNFLPHFLHVVSFILLTAGVMDCGRKGCLAICLFWLITCAGFELGQKYSAQAADLVPDWFDGIFILENTRNYFLHGTYCHFDMAATIIGSILAYTFLLYNRNKGESYDFYS